MDHQDSPIQSATKHTTCVLALNSGHPPNWVGFLWFRWTCDRRHIASMPESLATLPSKHRALGPKEKQTPCEGAPFSLPGPWTWTVVITLSDLDVYLFSSQPFVRFVSWPPELFFLYFGPLASELKEKAVWWCPKARRPEGPKARRPEGPKARRPEGAWTSPRGWTRLASQDQRLALNEEQASPKTCEAGGALRVRQRGRPMDGPDGCFLPVLE